MPEPLRDPAGKAASSPDSPVLIVGAGPVGLVLACELLQQGVPVRIIDADRRQSAHSRATSLWPRILELLDRIGVTEELVERAHRVDRVSYYSAGRHLGAVPLGPLKHKTPYPFGLALPQTATEEVLERRLRELGGEVMRGWRLTGVVHHDDGVQAEIATADGPVEYVDTPWLIGADGAHSTVRDLLGVAFEGPQLRVCFAIGDALIDGAIPEHMAAYCWSTTGGLALAALGERVFRVAVRLVGDPAEQDLDRDFFERVIRERGPRGRAVVGDVRFSTAFEATVSSAAAFRSGRCFLVGDAAHVMSPAGGQGMNTGIQDAVNLGWKLAGVQTGRFPAALLDSYDTERRRAAQLVSGATARQTKLGGLTDPREIRKRDWGVRKAGLTGQLRKEMAPALSQLTGSYATAAPSPGGGPRVGDRVPAIIGRDVPGWIRLAVDRPTALFWTAGPVTGEPWSHAAELLEGLAHIVEARHGDHPELVRFFGRGPLVALVRPDGHLAALAAPAEAQDVALAARAFTVETPRMKVEIP